MTHETWLRLPEDNITSRSTFPTCSNTFSLRIIVLSFSFSIFFKSPISLIGPRKLGIELSGEPLGCGSAHRSHRTPDSIACRRPRTRDTWNLPSKTVTQDFKTREFLGFWMFLSKRTVFPQMLHVSHVSPSGRVIERKWKKLNFNLLAR